jgi:F0F1-type ATP synthase assembly protein I
VGDVASKASTFAAETQLAASGLESLRFMSPGENDPPRKKSMLVQLANYSQLAFIFPAATVAGWLIGLALDHWLHTTWLYLAGLILGIVAGFVELIRTVTSSDSNNS